MLEKQELSLPQHTKGEKHRMDDQDKHVVDCKIALQCWDSRRHDDLKGKFIPKQIIQQILARQKALITCLSYMANKLNVDFKDFKILDVGSGSGFGLTPFILAGFSMNQLHGIDLFEDRIKLGKKKYPGINFSVKDATQMDDFISKFDMVMEQFCFCHIMDNDVIKRIAEQMLLVVKPGGYILVQDWAFGKKKWHYNGISQKKIKQLFKVDEETDRIKTFPSQLAPTLGRLLSKYAPPLYPIVGAIFPFLVLSHITLLRCNKKDS